MYDQSVNYAKTGRLRVSYEWLKSTSNFANVQLQLWLTCGSGGCSRRPMENIAAGFHIG